MRQGLADPFDQQRPDPLAPPGAGARHQSLLTDPQRPGGLAGFDNLQGAPEVGPVPQQQGTAGHRAEAAQVAAAGEDLSQGLAGGQGAQRQSVLLRHDHGSSLGQQGDRPAGSSSRSCRLPLRLQITTRSLSGLVPPACTSRSPNRLVLRWANSNALRSNRSSRLRAPHPDPGRCGPGDPDPGSAATPDGPRTHSG